MDARINSLDGLRGFALLLVIYQHSLATAVSGSLTSKFPDLDYAWIIANGWMGVSLFFILSGFVLALPYLQGNRSMANMDDAKAFIKHRAGRLIPLFLFMAFVSYAMRMADGHHFFKSLFLSITTLSMFTVKEFFPRINGPFWTLAIELWYSAAFPLIIYLIYKKGLKSVMLYIFVIALVFRIPGAYFEFGNYHINPLKDFFLARFDDFLVGILIAYLFTKGKLPSGKWLYFTFAIPLLIACVLWDLRVQNKLPLMVVPFINYLAQIGFGSLIVLALANGSVIAKVFNLYAFRLLGVMCFSLYCWHGLLITQDYVDNPFYGSRIAEFWILLLILSAFTYKYIEFPKADWRRLFLLKES
jgi:peptidoglycan/LPS O-acetylase OafA/YrhL